MLRRQLLESSLELAETIGVISAVSPKQSKDLYEQIDREIDQLAELILDIYEQEHYDAVRNNQNE